MSPIRHLSPDAGPDANAATFAACSRIGVAPRLDLAVERAARGRVKFHIDFFRGTVRGEGRVTQLAWVRLTIEFKTTAFSILDPENDFRDLGAKRNGPLRVGAILDQSV